MVKMGGGENDEKLTAQNKYSNNSQKRTNDKQTRWEKHYVEKQPSYEMNRPKAEQKNTEAIIIIIIIVIPKLKEKKSVKGCYANEVGKK